MTFILIAGGVFTIFWFMARSMERDRSRRRAVEAARRRVVAEHGLDEIFVSEDDGSLIGLSAARRILVLGGEGGDWVVPYDAICSVEGLRDGTILVRADREAEGGRPTPEHDAMPPERISSLTLRITADVPTPTARSVLFLDGGKHGLQPHNAHLRQQAALTEAWYRKVVEAMQA